MGVAEVVSPPDLGDSSVPPRRSLTHALRRTGTHPSETRPDYSGERTERSRSAVSRVASASAKRRDLQGSGPETCGGLGSAWAPWSEVESGGLTAKDTHSMGSLLPLPRSATLPAGFFMRPP